MSEDTGSKYDPGQLARKYQEQLVQMLRVGRGVEAIQLPLSCIPMLEFIGPPGTERRELFMEFLKAFDEQWKEALR